jgi:uncharacterized protein YndB with AHSA1/START domain
MDIPDRIEKTVLLPAPLDRAWSAIADARRFGDWFGVAFDGPFAAGARVTGVIRPTTVDPEVAKLQAPHAGTPFEIAVVRLEAPRHFAFRWHPFAVDPAADAAEPTTLVEFELAEAPGGTRLRITESGFAALPPARRASARAANEGGWEHQGRLVATYLRGQADGLRRDRP